MKRKEEEMADIENKTQEIRDWIEGLLKEKLPKVAFREVLLDGVVLCKLANAIKNGCIKKFHKKPRMLMMKMENIAFFLTACKSRFNIPQAVIFAPTDIHDDSDPTSMRKVINVLLLMKQEMGGGPSAAEAAKLLEEEEKKRDEEIKALEEEDKAQGIEIEKPKPKQVVPVTDEETHQALSDEEGEKEHESEPVKEPEEPEIEPEPQPKHVEHKPEPKVESKTQPKPVEQPKLVESKPAEIKSATNGSSSTEFDYYLKGKIPSDHAQVQAEIVKQLVQVIDSELSLESKLRIVAHLQGHMQALSHKVMVSSNDELKHLAHDMGLGNSLSDIPTKDRQWYIDFILKHGRAQ